MLRLATIAVIAGCLSSACSIDVNGAGVSIVEEKTFAVTGVPDLMLRTTDGSVEVRSWDRSEIQVEIHRRAATTEEAEALEVTTAHDGNRVAIEARNHDRRRQVIHFGNRVGESVSFVVRVPRQLTLDATTGDGSISVDDLDGTLALRSGDGSIRGGRVQGDLSVRTGDGSISMTDAGGQVALNTGDGAVRLSGRVDALRVHTGDGSVTLDLLDGSEMAGDWSLETGDGAITATLPSQFSAEVDAATGDGSIRVNDVTADRGRDEDRRRLRVRLGAGGRTLAARTGDGSINIRSR